MAGFTKRLRERKFATLMTASGVALMLFAPMTAATASSVDPITVPGNSVCEGEGQFKVDAPATGSYDNGTFYVDITVTDSEDGPLVDFAITSDHVTPRVDVKGGDAYNKYLYEPPVASDEGLHAPVNSSEKYAGLSHLCFYYETPETTTTTTTTTTTSTTTTTVPETTTTTSTTVPETTTTTTVPATTTTTTPPTTSPPTTNQTNVSPESTVLTTTTVAPTVEVEADQQLAATGSDVTDWFLGAGLTLALGGLLLLLGDKQRYTE